VRRKSANSLTWNNWNVHTWGTTLEYKVTPTVTLKGGVMEQNPDASSRNHAWSWSTKGSKGVLLPVEIEARPLINGLPGRTTWAWCLPMHRKLTSIVANPAVRVRPGRIREAQPDMVYVRRAEPAAHAASGRSESRLSTSVSMSLADQSSNYMHQVYAASLRYRGLFDARRKTGLALV
jgi:porin